MIRGGERVCLGVGMRARWGTGGGMEWWIIKTEPRVRRLRCELSGDTRGEVVEVGWGL